MSPTRNVQPTNDFVRFEKAWTAMSIPDCFRARVRGGDAKRVALGLLDRELSYQELDQLSDRVAHALISLGGLRPEPIPLLLEHDAPVPSAMLGVLKARKFYVPLDPSYPLDRNRYVLEDSQAKFLLTNSRNISRAISLCGRDCRPVNLDDIVSRYSGDVPTVTSTADDLVQVLYTSGSTGKPKGVMHTHHSLLYNVMRHTNGRHICRDDRIAILFSYSFGPAIVNLFSALLNGAAAFPFNIRELGVVRLAEWLIDREITQFHTVPTLFRHFVDAHVGMPTFPKLRLIQLGGETMFSSDLERFKEHFGDNCLLSVGMGSAESGHVFDCGYDKKTECGTEILPVGYPVEDTETLLLDAQGQPVGFGCVGEIAIKGSFLSQGYWRQPELTKTAFLPDPAGGSDRIYLTGDLGCMLPDGCVFHLGRKDARVKIRGYRIEIPEVEAALLHVPGVREVAVIAQDGPTGDKRLVAYVVSSADEKPTIRTLRKSLREKLPDYMVPTAFVVLESLPLLPNGKVDRQALLDHGPTVPAGEDAEAILQNPRSLLEAQLCAIWEELLNVPHVGMRDDFFDLGGDSLLAVEMVARIGTACGRELSLSDFASGITIERLAQALTDQERQGSRSPLRIVQAGGSKRPFFFHNGDCETGGLYCRGLARELGPDQPFYSLMAHGFYKDQVPESIEAMAADRLQSVLAIQPTGPYRVGGFCYGGVVAFEMARQLRQRGHGVEAVLMIDSRARNLSFRFVRRVVASLAFVLRLTPGTEAELFRRLKTFLSTFREACEGGAWRTTRVLGSKVKSYAIREARLLYRRFVRSAGDSRADVPPAWDVSTPWRQSHKAIEAYIPGQYAGRVVLFRSTSLLAQVPDEPTAGWRHVTPEVAVEWLRGDHRSCVTKHVADLAQKMRSYLADTDGSPSANVESTPLHTAAPADPVRIGQA